MEEIKTNFENKCKRRSDINEHLPTLMNLSKECETICEFGVRSVVSTWAFLYGLTQNNSHDKNLLSVDIKNVNIIQQVIKTAKDAGINMKFICENSIKCEIPETDMLFIDTWHIYGHLKRELEIHHNKVKKYIVMHDTELDKIHGESIRGKWNIKKQSEESGYSIEEISTGLQKAIDEFLEQHQDWKIHKVYSNNNGLTILKKF
jgi:hypothetical protein